MSADEPQTGQTLSLLAHYGFSDLELTLKNLDELETTLPELIPFMSAFQRVSNPDQALFHLVEIAKSNNHLVQQICSKQDSFTSFITDCP